MVEMKHYLERIMEVANLKYLIGVMYDDLKVEDWEEDYLDENYKDIRKIVEESRAEDDE